MRNSSESEHEKGVRSSSPPWHDPSGELRVADIVCARQVLPPGSVDRLFHHQWALILVERGGYQIGLEPAGGLAAQAGEVLLMRPKTMHAWTTDAHPLGRKVGITASFAIFSPPARLSPLLDYPEVYPHYSKLQFEDRRAPRRIRRCLGQMIAIFNSSIPRRAELQFNLLEQILLWCAVARGHQEHPLDKRIELALEYMSSNLGQPLSIGRIARAAHVSRSTLSLVFERQLGESPTRYLERLRIERAKQLLRMTGHKLDVIAESLGFCDAKYFSNRFKRLTGLRPREFRRQES